MAEKTKREQALIERLMAYRDESTDSDAYKMWKRELVVSNQIRAGKQYPDSLPGRSMASNDMYLVFPYLADIGDRLVAMISGGRLSTHMVSRAGPNDSVINAFRNAHVALQEEANLKGYFHEAVADMVWYGHGWVRWYMQRDPVFGLLPRVERIYPGQCWFSPYSRDPYSRTLGSPYWGYENLKPRRKLMLEFNKHARQISDIDFEGYTENYRQDDETDPMYDLLLGGQRGRQHYSNWMNGQEFDRKDHSHLRVIEMLYSEGEIEDIGLDEDMSDGLGFVEREQWHRAVFILPGGEDSIPDAIVVADEKLPYTGPNIVGVSSWLNAGSAYSLGPLSRGFDAQRMLDTLLSLMMKTAGVSARFAGVILEKAKQFVDPVQRQQLERGEMPLIITVRGEAGIPLDQLIKQLKTEMPNFGEFQTMITTAMTLIERMTGVNNIARGEVSPSQRISARGLQSLMTASLSAQETPQMHVESSLSHCGRILQEMMQHHLVGPFNTAQLGSAEGEGLDVNQPLPVEMIDLLDQMSEDRSNQNIPAAIPNALRVERAGEDGEDGEDIPTTIDTFAVDFDDPETAIETIEGLMSEEGFIGADIIVNDISVLDIKLRMMVDPEYREHQQELIQSMQAFLAQDPTRISTQTQFETIFDQFPEIDWDTEEGRLLGDRIKQQFNAIDQLPEEQQQQMFEGITQMFAQLQASQQAPGGQPGVTPQAQPPNQPQPAVLS